MVIHGFPEGVDDRIVRYYLYSVDDCYKTANFIENIDVAEHGRRATVVFREQTGKLGFIPPQNNNYPHS